jgi:vancomycin resistance protein YoaR
MKKPAFQKELIKLWKNLRKKPSTYQAGVASLAAITLVAILYLVFSLAYLGRVYPRVMVGNVSFGGLSYQQTVQQLKELTSHNSQPVTLRYQDKTQQLAQAEIDWHYDVEQTAQDIYSVGRSADNKFRSFFQQIKSVFASEQVKPTVSYDDQAVDVAISTFATVVDQPAVDATAEYIGDELIVTKEQVGKTINRAEVRERIVNSWSLFNDYEIVIQTYFDAPKVVLANEQELRAQAAKLSQQNLRLSWFNKTKQLTRREIKQLVGFVGIDPAQPITGEGESQQILTAQFTVESAKSFLQSFAEGINQPAVEPRLAISNGQLVVAVPSKNGLVVNTAVSAKDVANALNSSVDNPLVKLTMADQKPVINEDNLDRLGITERIGYGITSFAGSPANRIHNIKTGVSFLQSALVAPGKEFSTVGTLGAVDNTTGYLPELVIKENRTVPEYGGGLCQVSTTLFRSVLSAGLKITERRNHSYRVSYYEPPVGLDATIYLPKPDFMFLNDTQHHILIQGRVVGNNVIFELWGTSDGRTSTVSDPKILSVSKPGKPIKVETDTLPLGEEKQIERAHDGAVTIAYYTVKRDGKIINEQTFKSVYKAWPARYLVGTNPDLPPSGGD